MTHEAGQQIPTEKRFSLRVVPGFAGTATEKTFENRENPGKSLRIVMAKRPSYKDLLARIAKLESERVERHTHPSLRPSPSLQAMISSQTTTRQELIDQLRFIRILFDTVPNPIFYKNKEGVYLGCNQSFSMQILGISPEDIVGRTLFDLPENIPRELAEIYFRQDQELMRQPGKQIYDAKVRCADGIFRDFIFYKATYMDYSGEVAGIIGLMLDVTERKKMQIALKESEEKYRSMMESMNDAVYICSPDYRISYMNPKMIQKIGYDATGQLCYKVLHNLESQCPWCTFSQVRKGKITEVEVSSPKDGQTYIITNSPIFHHDGSISKMTIYRDKTNRKKVEEELLKARKIEATGVFAGCIAHDYNNLLLTILGNLLMLKKEMPESLTSRTLLLEAEAAAQKAARLTKRLLAFTHGDSLALERHDPGSLIENLVKRTDHEKKYTLDLHIPPGLPPVYVDSGLISMAMGNIITNAKEAMESGGIITISVNNICFNENSAQVLSASIDSHGEYVCIDVTDQGTGIEEEVLPKIFDPYFSTKQRGTQKGLGLGLSTSYSIIRKHNGTILVKSTHGAGTTVSIYLPVNISTPSLASLG